MHGPSYDAACSRFRKVVSTIGSETYKKALKRVAENLMSKYFLGLVSETGSRE